MMRILLFLATNFAVMLVLGIILNVTGIAGNIVNTLYIIIVTMLIATPIGVGAAVYLNEYATNKKLVLYYRYVI